MLLNDVQKKEDRLAYLLGLSVERHVFGRAAWTPVKIAAIGACVFLLLWLASGLAWR
jgi:hypothetical protein